MRFQKSIRIAPGIRINLSKSGVGVSVGPKGLKVGVDGQGRRYSRVGIPGVPERRALADLRTRPMIATRCPASRSIEWLARVVKANEVIPGSSQQQSNRLVPRTPEPVERGLWD